MAFPTDQTVSRLGQVNQSGGNRELFRRLYTGEVMRAFAERNIMRPLHRTRTLRNGKSTTFPLIGTTTAKYHTPGQLIEGQKVSHQQRTVTIDDLLISPVFIANIDEAMNHYDVRGAYAQEAGMALANIYDRNVLRMVCKAAAITDSTKAAAAGVPAVTGEVYTDNQTFDAKEDEKSGDKIVEKIFAAKTELEEKDITGDAFVILPPAQYYALFNATDTTKMLWMNRDVGGGGSYEHARVPLIAGMRVYMSNHIPQTDESSSTTDPEPLANESGNNAKYRGNYENIVGVIMTQDAVCTAHLMDVSSESEYQMNRQGTLMLSKMAVGHNILRPACAITLIKTP